MRKYLSSFGAVLACMTGMAGLSTLSEPYLPLVPKPNHRLPRRARAYRLGSSIYPPHQGDRECARRRRQMAAGQITGTFRD